MKFTTITAMTPRATFQGQKEHSVKMSRERRYWNMPINAILDAQWVDVASRRSTWNRIQSGRRANYTQLPITFYQLWPWAAGSGLPNWTETRGRRYYWTLHSSTGFFTWNCSSITSMQSILGSRNSTTLNYFFLEQFILVSFKINF